MTGELTNWCNHYYNLTLLVAKREEHFNNLLDNAPPYCGQTNASEIDDIISYNRKLQAYKAKKDKTFDGMMAAERTILKIMQHFEIPPYTVLSCEIPGELEYELWADEFDRVHTSKTNDLAPAPDNPNIIVIKLWSKDKEED